MKTSVRVAAKAHNAALVVILVCTVVGVAAALIEAAIPGVTNVLGAVIGYAWPIAGLSVVVILASGFHIAVSDALQRMERRDRSSDQD